MKPSPMIVPGLKTADEIAADIWKVPVWALQIKTRKREVVEARMVLMCYRNRFLKLSQAESAGKYKLSHNATIHACKTVDDLLTIDKSFREKFETFINSVCH